MRPFIQQTRRPRHVSGEMEQRGLGCAEDSHGRREEIEESKVEKDGHDALLRMGNIVIRMTGSAQIQTMFYGVSYFDA